MSENENIFLTTEELAERWKFSANTLKVWRVKGRGPDYIKIGSSVRYSIEDILAFEKEKHFKSNIN